MEYRKSWLLYLDGKSNHKGEDLTKYTYCIGSELNRNNLYATIRLNGSFGGRKEFPDIEIDIPIEHLSLGYISGENIKYLKSIITKVEENDYTKIEHSYGPLVSVFKFEDVLNRILSNNGVINNKTIEEIALDSTSLYYLFYTFNNSLLLSSYLPSNLTLKTFEEITAIEAMKRYGLSAMDNVIERTYHFIGQEFERERKLKDLLK